MHKFSKISIFILILSLFFSYAQTAGADILVTNAEVSKVSDGRALLSWRTNELTKGTVYYGEKSDALTLKLDYVVFSYSHELTISGLQKDKTYYYKIVAKNQSGQEIETFIQNFSTKNMKDTITPTFIYKRVEEVTANAVALRWVANEDVKATVIYNMEAPTTEKEKKQNVGSYKKDHILYLYNFKPQNAYFAKVTIEDKDGNKTDHTFYFTTHSNSGVKDGSGFSIYAVEPMAFDPALVRPESVTIKWRTTLVSQAYVSYGLKPGSYGKTVYANDKGYSNEHSAEIADLKPNTTYYFKITANDSLYRKSATSPEYSFTTSLAKIVLGDKIVEIDSDKDGLTDGQENSHGTDAFDADTDNDGYADGMEVANLYNPKGYGRLISQLVSNTGIRTLYEKSKESELKSRLEKNGYKVNFDNRTWLTFTNAYTFGGYSLDDVMNAIKGKKKVHPSIPFSAWRYSGDYQD